MRFRLLAILVVLGSLGLKFHGTYASPIDDFDEARANLAVKLQQAGFAVSLVPHQLDARRGGCAISARLLDPHGTYRAYFASRLSQSGGLAYAWKGTWHNELPRFRPLLDYYVKRELVRQGVDARRHAVWMVSRQGECANLQAELFDLPVSMVMQGG